VCDLTTEGVGQLRSVVRVELDIEPAARDGDVREALIDEGFPALRGIDLHRTRSAVRPWLLWLVTA